ncbi:MAG TPA: hypothetical protein PKA84_01350, partial [Rubrivivax sp.]|nr:hypothetical protein [Rubrivivax sp.]
WRERVDEIQADLADDLRLAMTPQGGLLVVEVAPADTVTVTPASRPSTKRAAAASKPVVKRTKAAAA